MRQERDYILSTNDGRNFIRNKNKLVRWTLAVLLAIAPIEALSAAANPSPSLQPPYRGTFFYPWYATPFHDGEYRHWNQDGRTPPDNLATRYAPIMGPYSSNDDAIIYWQIAQMAKAKQQVAIASWWGQGSFEDKVFDHIVTDVMNRNDNPDPQLKWAIHYELESKGNPSVDTIVNDLDYIKKKYTEQTAYLKINGKPVIFVFTDGHEGLNTVMRWHEARKKTGFYISLRISRGWQLPAILGLEDSFYQYSPSHRIVQVGRYSVTISPGFWPFDKQYPTLNRDLGKYKSAISAMVATNTDWYLTFWNERHEGTDIEPSNEYGGDYVDALNK